MKIIKRGFKKISSLTHAVFGALGKVIPKTTSLNGICPINDLQSLLVKEIFFHPKFIHSTISSTSTSTSKRLVLTRDMNL